MKFWLVAFFLGSLTYFGRMSFILVFSHWEMPPWFNKALRFVPVAALSAIIAPNILRPDGGTLDFSLTNPKLIAALITIGVAYFSRSLLVTIVCGMVALWIAQWVLG